MKSQTILYAYHTHPMQVKTTLCTYSAELYENPNNSLYLSDQLDDDHRLDLLLLPFLPSREEKEVGLRGRSPRESPNEPLTLTR